MSYCRWSSLCIDGKKSDLYMYDDVAGGITLHWKKKKGTFSFNTRSEVMEHLKQMEKEGFVYPYGVYLTLVEELDEFGDTGNLEPLDDKL